MGGGSWNGVKSFEEIKTMLDKDKKLEKIETNLLTLKAHINYKDCIPLKGESQIKFTLRAIAHLVSPPQIPNESDTIECTDLRDAILLMEEELEKVWKKYN